MHEAEHFASYNGSCMCECAECTLVADDLCICPDCPGGCDMPHRDVKAAELRAEAARLIERADALDGKGDSHA